MPLECQSLALQLSSLSGQVSLLADLGFVTLSTEEVGFSIYDMGLLTYFSEFNRVAYCSVVHKLNPPQILTFREAYIANARELEYQPNAK